MSRDGAELAAVVLAAGAGTRLRPLTDARPKPLCTVGCRPLLDWALARVRPHAAEVAVNVHHHPEQMRTALASRGVHVSFEEPEALGTAGALGRLRGWLAGRPVLVTNADAWYPPAGATAVADLVVGWDGERPRLLCVRTAGPADFGDLHYVGTAVLPWWAVRDLEPVPSGLYEVSWRALHDRGALDLVVIDLEAVDCGTPAAYLRANMAASGGAPVVEDGARVEGELVRSVVWAGEVVRPGERLVDAIRGAGVTLHPLDPPTEVAR
ncbi:MAG TPA: sugar phosphate nucleotidyltransferase [Actinomycetes bacterium]|jgi:GTP:adenosylcobinamide-phosphate guanylyltransferase